MSKFIELTLRRKRKKILINPHLVKSVSEPFDDESLVIISFGEDDYFEVIETYEEIKTKLDIIE